MHDALGKGRGRWSSEWQRGPVRCFAFLGMICTPLGCNPGELSDRQEDYLRDELDEHYSGAASPTSAGAVRTSDGTASEVPGATSADVTEATSSTSSAGTVPDSQGSTLPTDPTTGAPGGSVPPCATNIFQTACAGSFCHFQGTNLPPNFETDDVYTMLTTTKSGVCASAPSYIDLENPENSLLLLKVRGEQPGSCGGTMPPQPTTLTAEQMNCLEDWIGSL
jgi:hypothetical protein